MDLTEEKRKEIETTFNVPSLRENQVNGIKAICNGKDVFVGLKTGSGKSIIYCLSICHHHCYHSPRLDNEGANPETMQIRFQGNIYWT